MPIVSTIKMTARQFINLGEDPVGVRLELVEGEVAIGPSLIPEHSFIDRMLSFIVGNHVLTFDLGRLYGGVNTLFGLTDVRRPDLIYFQKSRVHLVGPKAIEGPPDLCVEIISPSSETIDKVDKFEQYEAAGVAHYWIIDPAERTARAWELQNGKYILVGEGRGEEIVHFSPFVDLAIPLAKLWHPPTQ